MKAETLDDTTPHSDEVEHFVSSPLISWRRTLDVVLTHINSCPNNT